jgi:Mg2+-importing ATPase
LSFFLHDPVDALIILAIVLVSGLVGFWQERGAGNAVDKLLAIVQIKAVVLRDGSPKEIHVEEIVPGDVVVFSAGGNIPGACFILDSKDLFVDESALTGETYPAETEFERGVRRFGYFLREITLMLVIAIFAINVYLARPILDSLLFSLALAVGLTPQLLPAIISINLAHGAKRMAREKVIVKRLASIENFGSMNVLCSDKTGTLTQGVVHLKAALDVHGEESEKVLFYAYLNSFFETGFASPIDEAIRTHRQFDLSGYRKLDEVPYDFVRKRLSIVVSKGGAHLMVTKGALMNVLDACSSVETPEGKIVDRAAVQKQIQDLFEDLSNKGYRTLGVAYRDVGSDPLITRDHETDMTFLGFLAVFDPPKPGIIEAISHLKHLGVSLKIITGDNHLIAATISQQIGLSGPQILSGQELSHMSDEALFQQVNDVDVFAEVEPNQKERIIIALRKAGNVIGYMGDGINDASALHAADASISVDSAVDVAKEAADILLLEKDLGVLVQGVREGRKTFANTLKYVFMATSANFGNMFSMAGASLFLPFLPLLPKQILLTNLMTDFPEMAIATDSVDSVMVEQPRRWDINFIRQFMITFGILSSVFDFLTFGVLLLILHAATDLFRTGWFLESVISASLIVLVIRSREPSFKSMPGRYLLISTLMIVGVTLVFPFTPLAGLFGFQPLPMLFLSVLGAIVVIYIFEAEMVKKVFYKRVRF